jgi:transposase
MPKPFRNPSVQTNEVKAPRTQGRRVFSPAQKLRIVNAADACAHGELGALLRREGVYHTQVREWRTQLSNSIQSGLSARKPGPAPKLDSRDAKIVLLDKQVLTLKKELAIVVGLVELQKKVQALFTTMQPDAP